MIMWTPDKRPSAVTTEKELSPSIFANIHLDHRLEGSHFQGLSFEDVIDYILKIFKYIEQNDCGIPLEIKSKIVSEISKARGEFEVLASFCSMEIALSSKIKSWEKYTHLRKLITDELAQKVLDKMEQSGGNVLFPGGFAGGKNRHGHIICYQLKKIEKGFLFLIFNTGNGSEYHLRTSKYKEQFRPIMAFTLPAETNQKELLEFITNRFLPRITPFLYGFDREDWLEGGLQLENKLRYNASKLYNEILADLHVLNAIEINPKTFTKITTQGQFSGTCAVRVLLSILKYRMGNNVFKHFLYQFRLQSIIDHFRIQEKLGNVERPMIFRPLSHAIENFSLTIKKWTDNGSNPISFLSHKQSEETIALLNAINAKVKIGKNSYFEKEGTIISNAKAKNTKEDETRSLRYDTIVRRADEPILPPYELIGNDVPSNKYETYLTVPNLTQFKNPYEYLNSCLDVLMNNASLCPSIVLQKIDEIFFAMPINYKEAMEYWNNLDSKNIKVMLDTLQRFIRLYCKTFNNELVLSNPYSRQVVTVITILCMASFVTHKHLKKNFNLGHFSKNLPEIPMLNRGIRNVSLDPAWDKRLEQLEQLIRDIKNIEMDKSSEFEKKASYIDIIIKPLDTSEKSTENLSIENKKNINFLRTKYKFYKFMLKEEISRTYQSKATIEGTIIENFDIMLQFDEMAQEAQGIQYHNMRYFSELPKDLKPSCKVRRDRLTAELKGPENDPGSYNFYQEKPVSTYSEYGYSFERNSVHYSIAKSNNYNTDNHLMIEFMDTSNWAWNWWSSESLAFSKRKFAQIRFLKNEAQVILNKDFYESNLDLLEDEDHQSLLLANLFTPNLLLNELKRNQSFADDLVDFINKGFQYHADDSRSNTANIFLLYLSSVLSKYIHSLPSDIIPKKALWWLETLDKYNTNTIEKTQMILMNCINQGANQKENHETNQGTNKDKDNGENSATSMKQSLEKLYLNLSVFLIRQFHKLTINDSKTKDEPLQKDTLKFILQSIIVQGLYTSTPKITLFFMKDLYFARSSMAHALKNMDLKWAHEILSESLIPHCLPNNKFSISYDFPIITVKHATKNLKINLMNGSLENSSYRECFLPEKIYDANFKSIFGNEQFFGGLIEDREFLNCKFTYQGKDVRLRHPKTSNYYKVIQMQMPDGHWYAWNPSPQIPYTPIESSLDEGNQWWTIIDKEYRRSFYCTGPSLKFSYKLYMPETPEAYDALRRALPNKTFMYTGSASFECISLKPNGEPDGYILVNLIKDATPQFFNQLFRFEGKKFIEIKQAKNSSNPIAFIINLPRYNLSWEGRRTRNDGTEFIWLQNSDFRWRPDLQSVHGIDAVLLMENINTHELIALFPRQEYCPSIEKNDEEYYKFNLDGNNFLAETLLTYKGLGYINYRYPHKHAGTQKYTMAKIKELNPSIADQTSFKYTLVLDSTIDHLHLAYLYLANHQPLLANKMLRHCRINGGITGTLEEIYILYNIFANIPSRTNICATYLDTKESAHSLYHMTKNLDPETLATQMLAILLLAEQKKASFDKPGFEVPKKNPNMTNLQEHYQYILHEIIFNIYTKAFNPAAAQIAFTYLRKLENVPIELRLESKDEFAILNMIFKGEKTDKISMENRILELEGLMLFKEEKLLKDRKLKLSDLSEKENEELNTLNKYHLNKKIQLGTSDVIKEKTIQILSPEFSGFDSKEFWIFKDFSKESNSSANRPLTLEEFNINLLLSPAKFLSSFQFLYHLATANNNNQAMKEELKKIVQRGLKSYAVLHELNQSKENNKSIYEFCPIPFYLKICVVLAYVFQNSEVNWPLFTTDTNSSYVVEEIIKKCTALSLVKPIMVTIPVREQKSRIKIELPLLGHKNAIEQKSIKESQLPLSDISELENDLLEKLNLEKLREELSAISQYKSESHGKSNKSRLENQSNNSAELNAGKLIMCRRIMRQKVYLRHLSLLEHRHNIQNTINHLLEVARLKKEQQQTQLLSISNQAITGKHATLESTLEYSARHIVENTIEKLITLFLHGDIRLYHEHTKLNEQNIQALHSKIQEFLICSTYIQQLERVNQLLDKLSKINENAPEFDAILTDLGEQISSVRAYQACSHPEFLVFEYLDNKLLRKEQVNIIELLLEKGVAAGHNSAGYRNSIIQLIMGGGKSKILLPLLALKKANGTNLSILEVPSSLFETNKNDIRILTLKLFDLDGFPLSFNRDIDCSSQNLKFLFNKLKDVIRNRQYIITTKESLQSLELKYLELLGLNNLISYEDGILKQKIEEQGKNANQGIKPETMETINQFIFLEKILLLIKEKGDVLIDECDTVLDLKQELNYTQGYANPVSLDLLSNIQSIYRLLDKVEIPHLNGNTTLRAVELGKAAITSQKDWQMAMKQLCLLLLEDKESPFLACAQKLSKEDTEIFILYLLNELKEIPKFINDTFSPIDKQLIGLLKGELELLPHTLQRKYNEHYGLPQSANFKGSRNIAIPYLASNTPNERAEFGSTLEIINYTIQTQDHHDILPNNLVKHFIAEFKRLSRDEINLAVQKTKESFDLKNVNTRTSKQFLDLTGTHLSDITQKDLEDPKYFSELQLKFSQNRRVRDFIILRYILTQIKEYPSILCSNTIQHISQFRSAQGITGTPWNHGSYHHALNFDKNASIGIDGQTMVVLFYKNPKIMTCELDKFTSQSVITPQSMINNFIIKQPDNQQIHALIDVGAQFKGYTNESIARIIAQELAQRPINKIKIILYFNENNVLCALPFNRLSKDGQDGKNGQNGQVNFGSPILIGSTDPQLIQEKTNVNVNEMFTFYDQRHTTGTDIKQPVNAIGVMTIDIDTRIRDVLQGAMRMRGLAEKQNIIIVVSKSAAMNLTNNKKVEGIESKENNETSLSIKDILKFTQKNQNQQLNELHLRAAHENIKNVIREILIELIYNANRIDKKVIMRKCFDSIFTVTSNNNLFIKHGQCEQELSIEIILDDAIKSAVSQMNSLIKSAATAIKVMDKNDTTLEYSAKLCQPVAAMMARIKAQALQQCLPSYKHVPSREKDSQVLNERQKELDTDKDKFLDRESQSNNSIEAANYQSWNDVFPLSMKDNPVSILSLDSAFPGDLKQNWQFSSNIYVTSNFINTLDKCNTVLNHHIKPVNFFIVFKPSGQEQLNALIISNQEFCELLNNFDKHKSDILKLGHEIWFITSHGTIADGTSRKIEHASFSEIMEQIRFFNGDLDLLIQDKQFNWMYKNTKEKIGTLKRILANHPDQMRYYDMYEQTLKESTSMAKNT